MRRASCAAMPPAASHPANDSARPPGRWLGGLRSTRAGSSNSKGNRAFPWAPRSRPARPRGFRSGIAAWRAAGRQSGPIRRRQPGSNCREWGITLGGETSHKRDESPSHHVQTSCSSCVHFMTWARDFVYCGLAPFLLALTFAAAVTLCHAQDASLATILNFETEQTGKTPSGWRGGPEGTIFLDSEIVHGGHWAARIERTSSSPN